MCEAPTISVLMPVYNCGHFLEAAIQSICAQTYEGFEFVIVNDGSTDDSLRIIQKQAYSDKRIRIFDCLNGGIVSALNAGLKVCRGEYIARMDGDDISEPDRFARQLHFLDGNPNHAACGTAVISIDETGQTLGPMPLPCNTDGIVDACLHHMSAGICHPAAMMRHDALVRVGGYRGRGYEDADLMLRFVGAGYELANIDYVGLRYRRRAGQITRSHNHEQTMAAIQTLETYQSEYGIDLGRSLAALHVRGAWQTSDLGDRRTARTHIKKAIALAPTTKAPWLAMCRFLTRGVIPSSRITLLANGRQQYD